MPAPRTSTYEPKKIYFSVSEACLYLDCSKEWLKNWTLKMGFKSLKRYNADELNRLAIIRKTNVIHRNPETGQFVPIPFKRKPGRKPKIRL